jgi:hypothetical protein
MEVDHGYILRQQFHVAASPAFAHKPHLALHQLNHSQHNEINDTFEEISTKITVMLVSKRYCAEIWCDLKSVEAKKWMIDGEKTFELFRGLVVYHHHDTDTLILG